MWQVVLIIALAISTMALAGLLWRRHRLEKDVVNLRREAVDGLVRAFEANIRAGHIPNIAGQVSDMLQKHLSCHKIIYLKNYREHLELNFSSGLKMPARQNLKLRLNKAIQEKLRKFGAAENISELKDILGEEYVRKLLALDLKLFFPVFSRDAFYGLYLIATDLDKNDKTVQLLTTALALNLATAYHIYAQDKRLQIVEAGKSRATPEPDDGNVPSVVARHLPSILRIKDSRRLAAELVDMLRKDCNFSRMFFYVKPSDNEDSFISYDWNLDDRARSTLRESLSKFGGGWEGGKIAEITATPELPGSLKQAAEPLRQSRIDYITALPWSDGSKALLGWSSGMSTRDVASRLERFRREALPIIDNVRRLERAEEMSYTDGLTEIHNYRFFRSRLEEEIGRGRRYKHPVALLILDIDSLKTVNDKFGHLAGDRLLIAFAELLTRSVRGIDIVSRYGGDEFCLIMPETDKISCGRFMERLRQKIESTPISLNEAPDEIFYSVSIGGAVFSDDAETGESLIHAADMALLAAKASGRNRSRMFQPEMSNPATP